MSEEEKVTHDDINKVSLRASWVFVNLQSKRGDGPRRKGQTAASLQSHEILRMLRSLEHALVKTGVTLDQIISEMSPKMDVKDKDVIGHYRRLKEHIARLAE